VVAEGSLAVPASHNLPISGFYAHTFRPPTLKYSSDGSTKTIRFDNFIFTPPPAGVRSTVMSMSVCPLDYIENHTADLHFVRCLQCPVVVARFSSGAVAICYVLPVLWMTSFFPINPRYLDIAVYSRIK